MKLYYKASFLKDLKTVKDRSIHSRLKRIIDQVEKVERLEEIPNIKKLAGTDSYYRIRIGNYRLGMVQDNDTLIFVRLLHRKDIYRYFP